MKDELPGWVIVVAIAFFFAAMGYAMVVASRENCRAMFAMARNERDSLDVMVRSNVYGGDHCRPK